MNGGAWQRYAGTCSSAGADLVGAARPSGETVCCRADPALQHTRPGAVDTASAAHWPPRDAGPDGRDAGSSVVEFVLLTSVVMLLLGFLPIQVGLWWHERHLLSAAAGEAALAASVAGADSGDAQGRAVEAASRFLETSRVANLSDVSVRYRQDVVQVAVTGEAITAVPGIRWTMTGRAQAPVERFVAP